MVVLDDQGETPKLRSVAEIPNQNGSEDGHLYVLGPGGKSPPPAKDLALHKIRSPLTGEFTDPRYNEYTNYGNMGCTNANNQGIKPPLRMHWVRRVEVTVKHIPVCGGGRMYTHTAAGQIIAVEQETGWLLWWRCWPGVYLSFTSPLYDKKRLLVPQAGIHQSRLRCLDAATGKLLWEAPFTGSPSWSHQFPPVMYRRNNSSGEGTKASELVIYASGSGRYAPSGSEKAYAWQRIEGTGDGAEVMSFIDSHENPFYPQDNRPYIWAWDADTGELVWKKDFLEYGSGGNDCGLALMDGRLYYSTYFGYQAGQRRRRGVPDGINGLTAALDPQTGEVDRLTNEYFVTAGCTLTAKEGRLYLGGYNRAREGTDDRHIWCLDAIDGSLIWRSDPVHSAVNVITVGERFIFSNAIRAQCHTLTKKPARLPTDSVWERREAARSVIVRNRLRQHSGFHGPYCPSCGPILATLIEEPVEDEAEGARRLFFIGIAADYGPESYKLLPSPGKAANEVDPDVAAAARAVIEKILNDDGGSDYSEWNPYP